MEMMRVAHQAVWKGRDMLGRSATLELCPSYSAGLFWDYKAHEAALAQNTVVFDRLYRCLTLSYPGNYVRGVEHLLGWCYAKGLDMGTLLTKRHRLPFDGTARGFERELAHALVPAGTLARYTTKETVGVRSPDMCIYIAPDAAIESLTLDIWVDYAGLEPYRLNVRLHELDLAELFTARPFWRKEHRVISRTAKALRLWQHDIERLAVDPYRAPDPKAALREIALHRLLDLLGALMLACPPGGRLAGYVHSRRAGHEADCELLNEISRVGLVQVS